MSFSSHKVLGTHRFSVKQVYRADRIHRLKLAFIVLAEYAKQLLLFFADRPSLSGIDVAILADEQARRGQFEALQSLS